ncbi:MAG: gamma-glutamyl-gamma-aminobutyrate hydrolase family protein, partial [Anaerolineales bacterium]
AGGIPLMIPLTLDEGDLLEVYQRLDGLLVPGGGDIDPLRYGAERHTKTDDVDPNRDRIEISLTQQALHGGKPFFGICRGAQVFNVALGGTLYQDIPSDFAEPLGHLYIPPEFPRDHLAHEVQVAEESLLARCLGSPIVRVNSRHHQAVKDLAPGLEVVARASDGIVEAIELPGHPFALGVQWHPENITAQPEMLHLFVQFIQAAANSSHQNI